MTARSLQDGLAPVAVTSWSFLLRIPSECLPLRRQQAGEDLESEESLVRGAGVGLSGGKLNIIKLASAHHHAQQAQAHGLRVTPRSSLHLRGVCERLAGATHSSAPLSRMPAVAGDSPEGPSWRSSLRGLGRKEGAFRATILRCGERVASSCQAGDSLLQEGSGSSYPRGRRLFFPAPTLWTMALLRFPALPGSRARGGQRGGLSARGGLRRRVTYRYDPRLQDFGLEPEACSRYGWEFFLASFGAFLLSSESHRGTSNRNFREISRESFELRRNLSFSFRSGISRSEIENFPTEDHEGVQFGSGGNPDSNERRRRKSSESF